MDRFTDSTWIGFNTQPPEGGCKVKARIFLGDYSFNTQPPEGGCTDFQLFELLLHCFNTQPPEGGCFAMAALSSPPTRFNTQPPEGGCFATASPFGIVRMFQHTAARRRLQIFLLSQVFLLKFQHTAARRRLRINAQSSENIDRVSTHSRPKAAAISA